MLTTARNLLPYPEPTDPITDYPGVAEDFAAIVESRLVQVLRKTTAKTVNNTVAATDLLNGELTIPAGYLGTTRMARLTAWGDWLNNSGGASSPRFQLALGGTVILDTSTGGAGPVSATRCGWKVVAEILNLGAANAQASSLRLQGSNPATPGTQASWAFATGVGSGEARFQNVWAEGTNGASAVNTAIAALLELRVINAIANAACETKLFGAILELGL